MTPIRLIALCVAVLFYTCAAHAEAFSFTFDWSSLKLCTSGDPNTVNNPTFVVKGLPKGATGLYFRLYDKDVPGFNHGGGWVPITKDGTIAPGAFLYRSPCPPDGSHSYEWTADARTARNGQIIERAKTRAKYP